jgi:5-methylcytosine-specific restriction endonuclease McrA
VKKYVKIYMEYHGIQGDEWWPCENCSQTGNQVHHLIPRGMGGSKERDYIENLIGLCFDCHEKAERKILTREYLYGIKKSKEWFREIY